MNSYLTIYIVEKKRLGFFQLTFVYVYKRSIPSLTRRVERTKEIRHAIVRIDGSFTILILCIVYLQSSFAFASPYNEQMYVDTTENSDLTIESINARFHRKKDKPGISRLPIEDSLYNPSKAFILT